MGLFNFIKGNKSNKVDNNNITDDSGSVVNGNIVDTDTSYTIKNDIGEEIHVFEDEDQEVRIKKLDMSMWISTGEQYCPECHKILTHKDGYFECNICKWSITDDEAEDGDGYPTLESTYENDFGYFNK